MRFSAKAAVAATAMLVSAPVAAQSFAPAPADGPPVAPRGIAASFQLPPHEAGGQFATPNHGLTAPETVWHLRTALNVAALGCRDEGEAATVAAYNALLAGERPQLAAASAAMEATYRARAGTAWQARFDDDMTRLYNFWAQPGAQAAFCHEAQAVLREAATVEPSDFPAFAAAALPRLEAPFTALFAAVETYRADLARWQAAQQVATQQVGAEPQPPVVIAAVTTVALVPGNR